MLWPCRGGALTWPGEIKKGFLAEVMFKLVPKSALMHGKEKVERKERGKEGREGGTHRVSVREAAAGASSFHALSPCSWPLEPRQDISQAPPRLL